jgi:hypothetical protein
VHEALSYLQQVAFAERAPDLLTASLDPRACKAHVSIRQHTSAYVSIRQHTSAYVSLRRALRNHVTAYVASACSHRTLVA